MRGWDAASGFQAPRHKTGTGASMGKRAGSRLRDVRAHPRGRRRWPLAVVTAVVGLMMCLVLVGCGLAAGANQTTPSPTAGATTLTSVSGPLTLSVAHQPGSHGLTITVTLANTAAVPLTYLGGCQQPYVVRLLDGAGTKHLQWPRPPRCYAITTVTLDPGKAVTFPVVSTDHLANASGSALTAGTYTVSATINLTGYNGAGPSSFTTQVRLTWTG